MVSRRRCCWKAHETLLPRFMHNHYVRYTEMIETISNTNNTIENQIVHCIRRTTAVFHAVHMQCACNVSLHIPNTKMKTTWTDKRLKNTWSWFLSIPIATLNAVPGNEWFSVSSWDALGMKFAKHVASKNLRTPHQGRPRLGKGFLHFLGHTWLVQWHAWGAMWCSCKSRTCFNRSARPNILQAPL